jgi:hypothetical protein
MGANAPTAFERLRQENGEVQSSLGYITNSRPVIYILLVTSLPIESRKGM